MNTRTPFAEWFANVRTALISIGYNEKLELSTEAWAVLYDEGHSVFGAVNESEFDGALTWWNFRSMQIDHLNKQQLTCITENKEP